ncbi:MAG: cobalamin B12-binding domain protein [Chloroflexi bacterium]|jgi:methylmalonyl-CoA mutase C-terminal domain/subunit|nr:cobalamin B12-binding domain protein [Chloroflexota bacterium]
MASINRPIRVLVAKPGLDGHDRGAKVIARGLKDAGMEVIYLGLRLTPEQIAEAAVQEDVDVIGLSSLSGSHLTLFPRIVDLFKAKSDRKILFIVGGIIPQKDIAELKKAGIAAVFGPGTPIAEISEFIRNNIQEANL